MPSPPVVISIAGFDPSSGAGISADIKTCASQGCYAVTSITALTVQSTQGVFEVMPLEASFVRRTLERLAADFTLAGVKLGMLGTAPIAGHVADWLEQARPANVVLDPVIRSSSGAALLDEQGLHIVRQRLVSLADVVTPNIAEAAMICGTEPVEDEASWDLVLPQMRQLAAQIRNIGAKAIVITGGHLKPANDYLLYQEMKTGQSREEVFPGEHLWARSTHGTGCAFSTALACRLALGSELPDAVRAAKDYVRRGIETAYPLGKGTGPLNHFPPEEKPS